MLPPQPKGGHMSTISRSDVQEWLLRPVLLPMLFVLLIAAATLVQW
jgi:hypothetical protein